MIGPMSREPRMSREKSALQTRRALLDAGIRLLQDRPGESGVKKIRATEVSREAGVSHGAFYGHWASQDDYRRDLLAEVLSPASVHQQTSDALNEMLDAVHLGLDEVVRLGCNANFDSMTTDPRWPIGIGLHADPDEETQTLLQEQYRIVTETWEPFYRKMIDSYGLEMRPPFTTSTMAVILTAIVEGIALRHHVEPSSTESVVDPETNDTWSLFGMIVLALVPSITRPKGHRDPELWRDDRDLFGMYRHLHEGLKFAPGTEVLQGLRKNLVGGEAEKGAEEAAQS